MLKITKIIKHNAKAVQKYFRKLRSEKESFLLKMFVKSLKFVGCKAFRDKKIFPESLVTRKMLLYVFLNLMERDDIKGIKERPSYI